MNAYRPTQFSPLRILLFTLFALLPLPSLFAKPPLGGRIVWWGADTIGSSLEGHTNGVVVIDGEIVTNAVVASGSFGEGIVVRSDGTVAEWGWGKHLTIPPGLTNVTSIAFVQSSVWALRHAGAPVKLTAESDPATGLYEPATPSLEGFTNAIAFADLWPKPALLVLQRDGDIINYSYDNSHVEPSTGFLSYEAVLNPKPVATNIASLVSSLDRVFALTRNGVVLKLLFQRSDWSYGYDRYAGSGPRELFRPLDFDGQILKNVKAIATSPFHTLALKQDGTIMAWGSNDFGQCSVPAGLRNVVAVAAAPSHSLALKRDGTVVAWGNNDRRQCSVPVGLRHVVAIAAGEGLSLAITAGPPPPGVYVPPTIRSKLR